MHFIERRSSPRFPFHSHGHLALGKTEYRGTVLDLSSSGGLFVAGPDTDEVIGEFCELRLLTGSSQDPVAFRGVVVNQRGQLLGIEFGEVAAASRAALAQIIEMNLGHPHLLDRDMPALMGQLQGGV
jgi:hypothetical protein